jgi:hypothetical protein
MGKRMKRIERIRTDFDSPSARPSPPQAEKKSVFIRLVRFIRFTILSLWEKEAKP